jgi:hypothetical protein
VILVVVSYQKGFIKTKKVKSLSTEEVDPLRTRGKFVWGVNSRSRALKARKLLNWEAKGKTIEEEVSDAVDIEAKALGLTSKYMVPSPRGFGWEIGR